MSHSTAAPHRPLIGVSPRLRVHPRSIEVPEQLAPEWAIASVFDQAIIAFIKRKYNLLIGERTAEQIKIEIGSAYPMDPEMTLEIKGRNLVDGLPKNVVVHSEDVREALLECLVKITSAIKETLERTPPELSADIIDHGITLTGGGALLRGLDKLIESETGIDVHVAEDPLDCVAKGAGAVLDHVDVLHDVLDTDGGHM